MWSCGLRFKSALVSSASLQTHTASGILERSSVCGPNTHLRLFQIHALSFPLSINSWKKETNTALHIMRFLNKHQHLLAVTYFTFNVYTLEDFMQHKHQKSMCCEQWWFVSAVNTLHNHWVCAATFHSDWNSTLFIYRCKSSNCRLTQSRFCQRHWRPTTLHWLHLKSERITKCRLFSTFDSSKALSQSDDILVTVYKGHMMLGENGIGLFAYLINSVSKHYSS